MDITKSTLLMLTVLTFSVTSWGMGPIGPIGNVACPPLPTAAHINEALATGVDPARLTLPVATSTATHAQIPLIPHYELSQLRELIPPPVGHQAQLMLATYRGEHVVVKLFPTNPYRHRHPGVPQRVSPVAPSEVRARSFATRLAQPSNSEHAPKLVGMVRLHNDQFAVVMTFVDGQNRVEGAYARAALLSEEVFISPDFPHSHQLFESGTHPETGTSSYPRWAAETTNQAIHLLKERVSVPNVLGFIASARNALAQQMGDIVLYFGIDRYTAFFSQSTTYFNLDFATYSNRGELCELKTDMIHRAEARGLEERIRDTDLTMMELFKPNHYIPLSGEPIPATALAKVGPFVPKLLLYHPSVHQSEPILKDVIRRLEIVQANDPDMSPSVRLTHFLIAMFGYYNALPYLRGSASIGHVFFQAFFHTYFGGKLSELLSQEYIDYIAMMDDPEEFVARYLMQLSSAQVSRRERPSHNGVQGR